MKVFFDTNVIIDTAVRIEKYPDSLILLNNLLDAPGFSLWASAISINNTEYIVSRLENKKKAQKTLSLLNDEVSIIPFRKSVFVKALEAGGPDFEDAIQMVSAEEMGMDYIVTRNKDHFEGSKVPVVTPSEFLGKWNAGEFDTVTHVPFLDLKAQHHEIYNEVDDRITDIISNTAFIMGKYVEEFEERFAAMHGAKYCIGVSSGTDALHLALMALGIGPGDRVVVPVNTFIATAEAVSLCGAEPIFVDCDQFCNIDTQKLKERLSAMSHEPSALPKAVIPVHLYGQPADMGEILGLVEEYDFRVIEDACQAHVARYQMAPQSNKQKKGIPRGKHGRWQSVGSLGDAGAFSFFPGKNLGAYGEAGAVVTNDDELYEKMKLIHNHGSVVRYQHDLVGHNYRMEAFQGAVLSVKVNHIEEWTKKRQEKVELYRELLKDVEEVVAPEIKKGRTHSFHLYVIQCPRRDELMRHLQESGIDTGLHYPIPLHLQKAYAHLGYKKGDFAMAERLADEILSLPMYPELEERQIRYVVEKIKGFYAQ